MIESNFIYGIVSLLLDGDKEGLEARRQKDFITEAKFDYTGVGVFVTFMYEAGIEKFKSTNSDLILDGVTIKSPELNFGADVTLFFKTDLLTARIEVTIRL